MGELSLRWLTQVATAIGMGDVGWVNDTPCRRLTPPLPVMLEGHALGALLRQARYQRLG